MRAPILAVAAFSLLTTGCGDLLNTEGVDSAVVSLSTYSNGAGGYVLSPIALVYADGNVTYTPPISGQCGTAPFDPDETTNVSGGETMNVGPFILTDLPTRQDTLYGVVEFGIRLYRLGALGGMLVNPGDTLTLTILEGGEFPAAAVDIRTAEDFSFDPVPVPDINVDIELAWRGAAEPGSQMRYSLRYANELSTGVLNEQLVCIFADDGEATIPANFLQGWVNAVGGQRQVVATRIRSREVQVDDKSRVTLISTFQVPTPQLNP
jgi:hypothetical protein